MIELRRMNRFDKLQYHASGFRDGCEPLIGEFQVDDRRVTAVISDCGLTLILEAGKEVQVPSTDSLNVLFQIGSRMTRESIQEILSNYRCRLEIGDGKIS